MSRSLFWKLLLLSCSLSSAVMTEEICVGSNPKHIVTDGVNLYVSYGLYSYRDYVSVIGIADNKIIKNVAIKESPQFMLLEGSKLFLGFFDSITIIDTQTLEKDTIETPSLSAMLPVGTKIYVANGNDNAVYVVDIKTKEKGKNIVTGRGPRALALANQDLYVANSQDDSITVIDMVTEEVKGTIAKVGGYPMAMLSYGNKIYVTNRSNTVSFIDSSARQIVGSSQFIASAPDAMIVVNNKLYVADGLNNYASIIDMKTDEIIGTIDVGDQPASLAFAHNKLYIANFVEGTITIKNIDGPAYFTFAMPAKV